MRQIRITHPNGLFLGSSHRPAGAIVDVADDHAARRLVAMGHAEHVVTLPGADPHAQPMETSTAPKPPEKAARR